MGDGEDLLRRVWDENADPRATTERVTAMAKRRHASEHDRGDDHGGGGGGVADVATGQGVEDIRASAWRLIRIEDPSHRLARAPTGYHLLKFRPSTMLGEDGNAISAVAASLDEGISTMVDLRDDQMIFHEWINNLAGKGNPRQRSAPDDARRPASVQEQGFLLRVLTGEISWSATDAWLTVSKPGVGSLDFVAVVAPK